MSTAAALLVLASAFLHALWNAALKREPDVPASTAAVLGVAALTAVAVAAVTATSPLAHPTALGWALAAGVCEGCYFAALAQALHRAPLGLVYTVSRGGSLLAVWPVSVLWLGEAASLASLLAAALVCGGLALTGLAGQARAPGRGVAWASACALGIAGYHLCYKHALGGGGEPAVVFALSLSVALPINLACLGRGALQRAWGRLGERPLLLGGMGLICMASFTLFLGSLGAGGAGAVLTLRNTSIVFAQALAWAIGERPARRQVAGAVLVAVGAVLLGVARG